MCKSGCAAASFCLRPVLIVVYVTAYALTTAFASVQIRLWDVRQQPCIKAATLSGEILSLAYNGSNSHIAAGFAGELPSDVDWSPSLLN